MFAFTFQVKVDALKLVKLCIENYFPPDLALLMNTFRGTTVDRLGPVIMRLMNDPSWEVRDSTLELVLSIATMANVSKYSANHVDSDLPDTDGCLVILTCLFQSTPSSRN